MLTFGLKLIFSGIILYAKMTHNNELNKSDDFWLLLDQHGELKVMRSVLFMLLN
jgi:hypothetical protein